MGTGTTLTPKNIRAESDWAKLYGAIHVVTHMTIRQLNIQGDLDLPQQPAQDRQGTLAASTTTPTPTPTAEPMHDHVPRLPVTQLPRVQLQAQAPQYMLNNQPASWKEKGTRVAQSAN